jgi:hypothetical protein
MRVRKSGSFGLGLTWYQFVGSAIWTLQVGRFLFEHVYRRRKKKGEA